jgi:selenocysteine lyase/cysteine desulfurase
VPDAPPLPQHTARFGDRSLFPDLQAVAYLNHAAISPPSLAVREAMTRGLDLYAALGKDAFPPTSAQRRRLKDRLADFIRVGRDEIALVPNTSAGVTAIATCRPWRAGERVVVFEGEFPANVTPWQQAAAAYDLELVTLSAADLAAPDGPDFTALDAALDQGVALVAVSAVQFQTGARAPLHALAHRIHDAGAELFVDAVQACGVVPIDARGLDYLACGGHKWMMGVEGAGFLYVRRDRAAALEPRLAGWLSHEDPLEFLFEGAGHLHYDRPIRKSADIFETGAPNAIGYMGLEASLAMLDALGPDAIFDHVSRYLDRLEAGLLDLGFTSARPADRDRQSGILAVRPHYPDDVLSLARALEAAGIACTTPDGWLRFSPHWPNDPTDEIPKVLAAAKAALTT